MKVLASYLLMIVSGVAVAAPGKPLLPDQYAYGYTIQVDGDESVYAVGLPEDVYRTAVDSHLSDVQVFNSRGLPVPEHIRAERPTREQATEPRSVPFFPLVEMAPTSGKSPTHITVDEHGTIIDIPGMTGSSDEFTYYLIDASSLQTPLSALQFAWEDLDSESFVLALRVESSDDLNTWRPLVDKATLASLSYNRHRLQSRRIEFSATQARYFRVQLSGKIPAWHVTGVEAVFPEPSLQYPRQWREVKGDVLSDSPGVYQFDTAGWWPLDRIRIQLPQRNTVARIALRSRANAEGPWHMRYEGLVYNLAVEGRSIRNDEIGVSSVDDRYWQLEVLDNPEAIQASSLTIVLGWVPYQLLFVAQGEGPFTLAYGSSQAASSRRDLQAILPLLETDANAIIKTAHLANKFTLGGDARLQPLNAPFPWMAWLLWSILILGVLVLGYMAWRLYQDLERQNAKKLE